MGQTILSELGLLGLNGLDGCVDVWGETLNGVADFGGVRRCESRCCIGIFSSLNNGLVESLFGLLDFEGVGDTASVCVGC